MTEVTPSPPEVSIVTASLSLAKRDVVRFLRQRSRVVGALASPLMFWVLMGSGIGSSITIPTASGNADYLVYFFPGTLMLILLFTAIFSTISIIEDRKEGFLQGVLVSPVGVESIVFGKILGGSCLAVLQALLFLVLAPVVLGLTPGPGALLGILVVLTLSAMALTGMGFILAWRLDSIQGFHAIMNLLLMPLWMMSGSLFPPGGSYHWVQNVMFLNPLTYCTRAMRTLLIPGAGSLDFVILDIVVAALFAAAMIGLSIFTVRRRPS